MEAWIGTSWPVFVGLTVVLVGGASALAGRAMARNWKPAWHVVLAALGLAVADRFLVYALFEGELLHPWGFLISWAVQAAIGLLSWHVTRVEVTVRQYPWLYRKTSPFSYAPLEPESREATR